MATAPTDAKRLSNELSIPAARIEAVLRLLEGGATPPFIARYRREATGGSSEAEVRAIRARLAGRRAAADPRLHEAVRSLLLAPPLGAVTVVGVMSVPGHECRCAVVDASGELVEHRSVLFSGGGNTVARARLDLLALLRRHHPAAFAVAGGNEDTESFVRDVCRENHFEGYVVIAPAAAAEGYGASERGERELPDVDPPTRAAVSVARRSRDPLAELVRIGVRDALAAELRKDPGEEVLHELVESCVHEAGIDVNTAAAVILAYVAGLDAESAAALVAHRQGRGPFKSRSELREVLGPTAFEQAAGFLRVRGGSEPLDATGIHPERYELVARIASDNGRSVAELLGEEKRVAQLEIAAYVTEGTSTSTLQDILRELREGGRDPRGAFQPPAERKETRGAVARAPSAKPPPQRERPRGEPSGRDQAAKGPSGRGQGAKSEPAANKGPPKGKPKQREPQPRFSNNPFADLKLKLDK